MLVWVAVVGRERRAVADVAVKDVEAWLPFSQSSLPNAEEAEHDHVTAFFAHLLDLLRRCQSSNLATLTTTE